jgi:S1-C subfamily serine protease
MRPVDGPPPPSRSDTLLDARLRILSGTRGGEVFLASQRTIAVGRHAESDLRFDPDLERAVSARHALLFQENGGWHIRDLGSKNGTLVNGRPIAHETPLRDGDRIAFGTEGPTAEFRTSAGRAAPARGAAPGGGVEEPSTVERIRLQLRQRTRLFGVAAAGLVLLLAGAIGASLSLGERQRAAWNQERESMRLQIDSIQWAGAQAVNDLERQLEGLEAALSRSDDQIRALELSLRRAESSGTESDVRSLRRQLEAASTTRQGQQRAATLDFRALQARSRPAVAMIYAELASGEVVTGTAFAVRADATLLTSRHVVAGADGRGRPRRIAIQFSDSEQVWPARLLAVSGDSDLAIVKVDNILGSVPVVRALNLRADTLAAGAPVAMIGFPRGGDAPPEGTRTVVSPLLSPGVLRSVAAERVEVQGYGAVGASGSPILDANGEVIAVVFGGRGGESEHTVFGVPAAAVARLLAALP